MKLWKKKPQAVEQPQEPTAPRIITGIERMKLEAAEEERRQRAEESAKWRESIKREIAVLEAEIGPQMAKLRQLRTALNPYEQINYGQWIWANQQAALHGHSVGSLLGVLGIAPSNSLNRLM